MSSSFTTPEAPASAVSIPEAPPSPEVPPYSPISPAAPDFPSLDPIAKAPQPDYMQTAPPPEPIDESTNPDAIALRAAISVLQVQRQRALQDLQTLEQQRNAAVAKPEDFATALGQGKVRSRSAQGILGAPDDSDSNESDADVMDVDHGKATTKKTEDSRSSATTFGQIPGPQNIVRCPPINWSKYHVAGEALDRLHHEQQMRPDPGLAQREPATRPPEHQIAAPYSPWKDKLPESTARNKQDPRKG